MSRREFIIFFVVVGAIAFFVNVLESRLKSIQLSSLPPENTNISIVPEINTKVGTSSLSDINSQNDKGSKTVRSSSSGRVIDPAQTQKISSELSQLAANINQLRKKNAEASTPLIKGDDVYAKALGALVNIFCLDNDSQNYILGSGAIVSPAGYVLTNAHLGLYFNKPNTSCELRLGSPARDFADASLIYTPDQSNKIASSTVPERDIAILKITRFINGASSSSLPYFQFQADDGAYTGETLYLVSYPTEFLGIQTAVSNTAIVLTKGTIDALVSVDNNMATAEAAYVHGDISAQHGSSGGVFIDMRSGKIVGLFVGITEEKTTAGRKQFAFLSSYIDSIIRQDKGVGWEQFLGSNP